MSLFLRSNPKKSLFPPYYLLSLPLRFLSTSTSTPNPNPSPNPNSDQVTSASYDHLINEAGRSRDFSTVESLLSQRIQTGHFNTTNTFKFVADDPTSLLPPALLSISSLPPGFGQKNAFDSLIILLCKSHLTHLTHHVLEKMPHCLNSISFYPILSSLSRAKHMAEVSLTLDFMKRHSIPPDATCYNYILSAHCHVGNLSAAADTLTTMLDEGLAADSLTFDALVLGACRAGRLDAAVALVMRMVEDGVKVLDCTYSHVISGLLGIGGYWEAVEFVKAVGGRERRLDVENFGVLGRGLVRRKRWEEVKVVVKEMEERGLEIEGKVKDFYETDLSQA
ncbi:hypothetical protein MRB53_000632 [Persea americana]|uniref:Uncharacterized protein n=1 Tax=Persea americana TaxID=3435 RepID=A0ACC2MQE5_PERAE|nr:hypothetical protein MRB53_000632 [Persea americana]|eukprot:TRINITY_DN80064_c0_g1_i1.p1 TRINITY_DN80064_c0_g1~~TRINITY_DN80064_c0_g1_i1.p1  ORF type:complete len:336 (-),score=67.35 TRINITY_DN80064_c0_g1_i1:358-1365(-)